MPHSPSNRSTRNHAGRFDGACKYAGQLLHAKFRKGASAATSFGPRRIQMHVIAHRLQIAVARAVHDQRLVAPAEQVAEQLVPPVEAAGVSAQKPFHPGDQIGWGVSTTR